MSQSWRSRAWQNSEPYQGHTHGVIPNVAKTRGDKHVGAGDVEEALKLLPFPDSSSLDEDAEREPNLQQVKQTVRTDGKRQGGCAERYASFIVGAILFFLFFLGVLGLISSSVVQDRATSEDSAGSS